LKGANFHIVKCIGLIGGVLSPKGYGTALALVALVLVVWRYKELIEPHIAHKIELQTATLMHN